MKQHEKWMRRALDLARRGLGNTSPNPVVGAVIVRDGQVVGEGWHQEAGRDHAEVEAIRSAGDLARGAALYVTLEPCNHSGRTPPCTEAIIEAGIREVRYAMSDPNPAVAGGGHGRLLDAGLSVAAGPCERESADLNRFWIHRVRTGRPYVIAKFAASLDGKIATSTGASQWITGEPARRAAHGLRAEVDVILVGAGTTIADDPELTVRLDGYEGGRQPLRVVLDSTGRVPLDRTLFQIDGHRTLVASTRAMPSSQRARLAALGVGILTLPEDAWGRISPGPLLTALGERGVVSVLVEGGACVLGSFFDEHFVDETAAFLAPIIIGGRDAPAAVGGSGVLSPSAALRLDEPTFARIGNDWLIRGRTAITSPSTS